MQGQFFQQNKQVHIIEHHNAWCQYLLHRWNKHNNSGTTLVFQMALQSWEARLRETWAKTCSVHLICMSSWYRAMVLKEELTGLNLTSTKYEAVVNLNASDSTYV
jgi:siroheme synthase